MPYMDETKTLRCGVWVAVSSAKQFEKASPDHQRAEALAHVQSIGVLAAEFVVPGESRSIANFTEARRRLPAYQQLYDAVTSGAIDILIFYDDTRLGRTAALVSDVRRFCLTHGVALYATTSPPASLDAVTQAKDQGSKISGAVFAALSEIEIDKLKERYQYGHKRRVRRGHMALGRIPYGYRRLFTPEGDEYYVVQAEEAAIVRRIFYSYVERDLSYHLIAQELNGEGQRSPSGVPWTEPSIRQVIGRAMKYAGYSTMTLDGDNLIEPGKHEPIISEDLAKRSTTMRQERTVAPHRTRSFRYARCLICGHCGHTMTTVTRGDMQAYRCSNRARGKCDYWSYVRDEEIHELLEEAVTALMQPDNLAAVLSDLPTPVNRHQDELAAAAGQLEKVMAEEKELARQLVARRITDQIYDELSRELYKRRAQVERNIRSIEMQLRRLLEQERRSERIYEAKEVGLRILNHQDKSATNAWAKRTLRVIVYDKSAWEDMGLPHRSRVEFI